jgi:hypothetical protein
MLELAGKEGTAAGVANAARAEETAAVRKEVEARTAAFMRVRGPGGFVGRRTGVGGAC